MYFVVFLQDFISAAVMLDLSFFLHYWCFTTTQLGGDC